MSGLVRSELRKVFSTRLWWGLLIGIALLSAGLAILQAAVAGLDADNDGTGGALLSDPGTLRSTYTAGLGVAYLFALALGVIVIAGERRHGTMSATVLAVPRRWKIVVAKLFALVGIGLGYGLVVVAVGVIAGAPVIAAKGGDVWMSGAGIPRALLLAVVAVALWALIGLGVGTLISNQVVALFVAVGLAWIVEPILGFALQALDRGEIARFFPTSATSAVVSPAQPEGFDQVLLPWWGGVLVLLGYALISALIGAVLTLRRDVT